MFQFVQCVRETQTASLASSKPFVHIITANTSKRQIKDKKKEEEDSDVSEENSEQETPLALNLLLHNA